MLEPASPLDALQLEQITKSFPGVRALRQVSFEVGRAEVHALLGENGAGKSTLIKVAAGALAADSGTVTIGGVAMHRPSPRAARALGLRVVHQERQIARHLSVAENVLLDRIPVGRWGTVSRRRIEEAAEAVLAELGIDLDPAAPAEDLSTAQSQLVELARAVSFDARVLVLDEPTASLQGAEVRALFEIVRRLRDRTVGIVFISHHLDEVFELADRITVLRDGAVAGTVLTRETTSRQLTSLIFGEAVDVSRAAVRTYADAVLGPVVVEADRIGYRSVVDDFSLRLRAGEVVALTGAIGSGASEVAQMIAGVMAPTTGKIVHHGRDCQPRNRLRSRPESRARHARRGVAFLPADRKRQGLLLDRSIVENLVLARNAVSRQLLLRPRRDRARAAEQVSRLGIRAGDLQQPVRALSGGNQQKVVLGRWLAIASSVLVFDEPTAGVDIPSKADLYRLLLEAARNGAAVLIVSSDYEEIHAVADRVVVLRNGQAVAELRGADATPRTIMQMEMEGLAS